MGTVTRATLRQDIAQHLGGYKTGTATGGSTTTVVDTSRIEPNNRWRGFYVEIVTTTDGLAPEGEVRLITDSDQSAGVLAVSPAFSAAVGADDTYALWPFQFDDIDWAIDIAVKETWPGWFSIVRDTTSLDTADDTLEYSLPAAVERLLEVYLLDSDGIRFAAPTWSVVGKTGDLTLVFSAEPDSVYDVELVYAARVSLGSASTSTLNVGASSQDAQAEEACANFIVSRAVQLLYGRRYRETGAEEDWNLWRVWSRLATEARRRGMPWPTGWSDGVTDHDALASLDRVDDLI